MLALAFALLSAASSVLAHGIVEEITIANPASTFTSYLPYSDPYKSPVPDRITRKFPSNGPVEDVTSADIQCNVGAVPAALVAEVAAGSQVAFNWTTAWPTSHIGPVITYMARAPSDITKWSPGSDAVWFKIDEAGLEDGKWAATDVLIANGGIHTVTIPASLKAGQYLVRHEIIALHAAQNYPGAQFYPMCAQFEVTGSGSALPDDADLVSFPGAYTGTSPGVLYNPYQGLTTYPIPGPAVWNGVGSGTGSGSGSSSTAAAPTTTAVASSTAAAATSEAASSSTAVASSTAAAATSEAASSTEPAATEAPEETSAPAPAPTTSTKASASSTAASSCPTSGGNSGAAVAKYYQCGGIGYTGSTTCVSGTTCKVQNPYYSQCL